MSNSESQPQEFHGSVQIQPETDRATEAGQRLRRALDELGGAVPDTGQAPDGPDGPPIPAAEVEAWIKAARDRHHELQPPWDVLDELLADYRLHRVTGTPLTEHACEGPHCCADLGTNSAEGSADTVQAPDVAALGDVIVSVIAASEHATLVGAHARRQLADRIATAVSDPDVLRALLGTDTPEAGQ